MNLLHKCNVSNTARFAFIAQLSCLIFQPCHKRVAHDTPDPTQGHNRWFRDCRGRLGPTRTRVALRFRDSEILAASRSLGAVGPVGPPLARRNTQRFGAAGPAGHGPARRRGNGSEPRSRGTCGAGSGWSGHQQWWSPLTLEQLAAVRGLGKRGPPSTSVTRAGAPPQVTTRTPRGHRYTHRSTAPWHGGAALGPPPAAGHLRHAAPFAGPGTEGAVEPSNLAVAGRRRRGFATRARLGAWLTERRVRRAVKHMTPNLPHWGTKRLRRACALQTGNDNTLSARFRQAASASFNREGSYGTTG